jgi:hypothetical protein
MNAMGHQVPNLIGVPQKDLAKRINKLVPDYMAMGSTGGAMGEMEMPLPDNTLPMMTGTGPFGPLEMGGMFTVVKVREGSAETITATRAGSSTRREPWPTNTPANCRTAEQHNKVGHDPAVDFITSTLEKAR